MGIFVLRGEERLESGLFSQQKEGTKACSTQDPEPTASAPTVSVTAHSPVASGPGGPNALTNSHHDI